MSEEHEKQFASWFAKFITQTQKLDYESICKKAFMTGVEAAQQSVQADLATDCPNCGDKLFCAMCGEGVLLSPPSR